MTDTYTAAFPEFVLKAINKPELGQKEERRLAIEIDSARKDVLDRFKAAYSGTPFYSRVFENGKEKPILLIEKMLSELDAPPGLLEAYERLKHARNELVEGYLRLALKYAKTYSWNGALADRFQDAVMGLQRAATAYDYRRGAKFITYATHWIWQKAYRTMQADTPIVTPLSRGTDVDGSSEVRKKPRVFSFHAMRPRNGEIDEPFEERCLSDGRADAERSVEDNRTLVEHLLCKSDLTDNERRIISYRFGLGMSRPMKQDEVLNLIKVTKQRVSQIERNARRKMRALAEGCSGKFPDSIEIRNRNSSPVMRKFLDSAGQGYT